MKNVKVQAESESEEEDQSDDGSEESGDDSASSGGVGESRVTETTKSAPTKPSKVSPHELRILISALRGCSSNYSIVYWRTHKI